MLVNRDSGCFEKCEEVENYGRYCDHFALNKFKNPMTEDWKFLVRMIGKMKENYIDSDEDDSEEESGLRGKVAKVGSRLRKAWNVLAHGSVDDGESSGDDD